VTAMRVLEAMVAGAARPGAAVVVRTD
jgi:hypothetical protein